MLRHAVHLCQMCTAAAHVQVSRRVCQKASERKTSTLSELTLQAVGSVSERQSEVVIGGAVGVQRPRHLSAADEAVLAAQHDDRAVDQLHDELLGLTWRQRALDV